ncbi:LapA family protein [Blastococcus litoris]|uniref:LapA family protein n=1 Tax=Blastococcus litoris TaxID=2171622 RepID=UPI000E308EAB|nr:LapA family protein [Blastococcus litoris]
MSTPEPRPAGTPGTDPTLGSPGGQGSTPPPVASAGPDGPARPTGGAQRHTGRTIGRTLALSLLVFVTVVLVLFVVFNTQTVDISLVFTDVRAPLVVALLIAAVLGAAMVGLLNALLTVRGRRKNR